MKVFWSWQNDVSPETCRYFIKDALEEAIKGVGLELGLEPAERPEIDHDTKDEAGMVNIAEVIFRKISESVVFVADLTPSTKSPKGKALPNPNVCIELGWAMNKPGTDKIIAVLNTAEGFCIEDLPFDVRNRRILSYSLAKNANGKTKSNEKKKLEKCFKDALKKNLTDVIDKKIASVKFPEVLANPKNPSIWDSYKSPIKHSEPNNPIQLVDILDCPRGYMRIIPESWNEKPPKVNTIHNLPDDDVVWPPLDGGVSGSKGAIEEGHIIYWGAEEDGDVKIVKNICCYFEKSGEFWVLHGTAISDNFLKFDNLINSWSNAMRQVFSLFDKFGASPNRKVIAGLFGVEGVKWPMKLENQQTPSRKNDCRNERQSRDWNKKNQLDFLLEALNQIYDLYNFPEANIENIKSLLKRKDPHHHLL